MDWSEDGPCRAGSGFSYDVAKCDDIRTAVSAVSKWSKFVTEVPYTPTPSYMTAALIQLRYTAMTTPTATSSSSSGLPSVQLSIGYPTDDGQTTEATDAASHGLSTGSKAAIGIIIPFSLLALASLVFMLWLRRKRNSSASGNLTITAPQGLSMGQD